MTKKTIISPTQSGFRNIVRNPLGVSSKSSGNCTACSIAAAGFGYWGKNLIRNFNELGVLRVVCDNNPKRRLLVEEQYPGVQFCDDYTSVLVNPEIAAVSISTPAVTHYDMVKQALNANKDVFVEKPLALTLEEAGELVDLAEKQEQILMVGHILRYHPAVRKLSELIDDGELGKIHYVYSNRLNIGKIRSEENILWSFAPHDISVILALLNEEPCTVQCHGKAYLSDDIADVTTTNLVFPSGVSAHIFVSWLHPFKEQRLVVVGSEKMAVFDDTAEHKLLLFPHKVEWKNRIPTAIKAEVEVVDIESYEPLKAELQHFLDCVENRTQPITDGAEGMRVLRVLDACESSLAYQDSAENNESIRTPPQSSIHQSNNPTIQQSPYFSHPTATIDNNCTIGKGTKIWHYSHILEGAWIGKNCIFGQNCQVAEDVKIGDNVKIQNNVSIYSGTTIEDDVFLGPSCVLTNVTNPRSQVNRHSLYEKTTIRRGATIGANATILCGIEIGRYAFVGAGAVVTKDVSDYALVLGNPARQNGWMSRHGHRLSTSNAEGVMTCPESKYRYKETDPGVLRCLDLDENAPLPDELAVGEQSYNDLATSSNCKL